MDSLCLCVSGVVVEAGESMNGTLEPVGVMDWVKIRVGWVMWHLMIVIVVSFGVGVLLGVQLG